MKSSFNPLDHPILYMTPKRLITQSAWQEHVPFAMFLMEAARPQVLVELGTYAGASYCAFCQAVAELKLNTQCYAVDTWQGDPNMAINYGSNILEDLKKHHDPLYSGFSHLLRCTFDEALLQFEDQSVDILHIDGFHSYEAVKHDFETWLPKMKPDGIVLFHDICVVRELFGVINFWKEIKQRYATTFEFHHCNGLGVLALSDNQPPLIREMVGYSEEQAQLVRRAFESAGIANERSMYRDLYNWTKISYDAIYNSRSWKIADAVRRAGRKVVRSSKSE